MNYRLVPMDRSHLKQVAALEQSCFSQPWSEHLLAEELINDNVSLVVAEGEGEQVLGYGAVRAVLDEGCLEKIVVAPPFRRQGVAESILNAYLRFGRANLAFLMLEVRAQNTPAVALYKKLGFQTVGRRKDYYTNPREDALIMTLEFQQNNSKM